MPQYLSWGAWTGTSITAATILDSTSAITAAISANLKTASQVSVSGTTGLTYNTPMSLRVINIADGADETPDDNKTGFIIAADDNATPFVATYLLRAEDFPDFKLEVTNPTGSSLTGVTVKYRQAVVDAS